LNYFTKSLQLARDAHEDVYETNVLINLAMINERLSNYTDAIANLEAVIRLQPQNTKIKGKIAHLKEKLALEDKSKTAVENRAGLLND
jgi:2-polyprenyl-3-methyl-5-hydroxy-6-metoxy-1,4-benzoquinol methylase